MRPADSPAPARPAAMPSVTTSPSTIVNTCRRPQPTARSAPISVRRPRTPASAAPDRNSAHTTRMSTSSASDSRSAWWSTSSAASVWVQSSVSWRAGRPNFPAGNPIVTGYGEAPAVMITWRPVAFSMSSPIAPILSSCSCTVPRSPDTRTRIDPIGAATIDPSCAACLGADSGVGLRRALEGRRAGQRRVQQRRLLGVPGHVPVRFKRLVRKRRPAGRVRAGQQRRPVAGQRRSRAAAGEPRQPFRVELARQPDLEQGFVPVDLALPVGLQHFGERPVPGVGRGGRCLDVLVTSHAEPGRPDRDRVADRHRVQLPVWTRPVGHRAGCPVLADGLRLAGVVLADGRLQLGEQAPPRGGAGDRRLHHRRARLRPERPRHRRLRRAGARYGHRRGRQQAHRHVIGVAVEGRGAGEHRDLVQGEAGAVRNRYDRSLTFGQVLPGGHRAPQPGQFALRTRVDARHQDRERPGDHALDRPRGSAGPRVTVSVQQPRRPLERGGLAGGHREGDRADGDALAVRQPLDRPRLGAFVVGPCTSPAAPAASGDPW